MSTAIIVVNFNCEDETISYVEKIAKFNIIDKIIVVDNMSTTIGAFDELKKLEKIDSKKIKVIQTDKNGGYSYGNNFGVKYLQKEEKKRKVKYDYIIISNPDIEIEEKAIENSIKVLESQDEIAVVAPRMYYKDGNPARRSAWKLRTPLRDMVHSTRLLELLFYKVLRNGEYKEEDYKTDLLIVEAISGSFFIIKKDVFEKINLFDENVFLFYEEDILGKKLQDLNLKIVSLNTEKFIHYESQTIGKVYNYFAKMKLLFESKMYYQTTYNNICIGKKIIFNILNVCRKIELCIEVPIRKLLKK